MTCERCEHCPFIGKIVGSRGPEDSPFVIIGESPGTQEVIKGEPFVGPSGVVLQAGLDQHARDSYPEPYIINAFKCFPGKAKDEKTLVKATQACHEQVAQELRKHPRKVILALGNAALWTSTEQYGTKITKERGKLFKSSFAEVGVVAATHPAFLLRGSGSFRQFKADIDYAVRLLKGDKPKSVVPPTYHVLESEQDVLDLAAIFQSWDVNFIAADVETSGFDHRVNRMLCAGFAVNGQHVYIVPEHLINYTAPLFDNRAHFIWHNGKFDIKFFHHIGIMNARVDEDTMLLSYAHEETRGIHDLEQVGSDWLGSPNWKNMLESHLPKKSASYEVIPKPVLYKYLAYDVSNTFEIFRTMRPIIAADRMCERQYTKSLIPISGFLTEVEKCGMYVDHEQVEKNRAEMTAAAEVWADKLRAMRKEQFDKDLNPNSPIQLAEFFYDELELPKYRNSRSTSADILEHLPEHPAVVALKNYRKIFKGLSTYVTPAIDNLSNDGRVHSTYLIHGTPTGRLASRNPNLQNIPRDPKIRNQFVAPPGKILMEVDLNQAELRSLAALSGDEVLCAIYTDPNSVGLHEVVRYDLYGNPDEWSPVDLQRYINKWYSTDTEFLLHEQKMRAKNVNFGIVYGITEFGLSEQIEDTPQEARRMLEAWAKKFPQAWNFIGRCKTAPVRHQNLLTVFGYRKRFGVVSPEKIRDIQNEAANFPHQSTAALITLHSGVILQPMLKKEYGVDIINTVHDSLLLEMDDNHELCNVVSEKCRSVMEQVPIDWGITRIPFKAETKLGMKWGEIIDEHKYWAKAA